MADYTYPYLNSVPKMTAGVGRDWTAMGLTEQEGIDMMRADIIRIRRQLAKRLVWFEELSYPRQDALTNMVFRTGIDQVMRETDMLTDMKNNHHANAAAKMRGTKWYRDDTVKASMNADIIETNTFEV